MSWKECDPVSERLEFVKLASCESANKSELCHTLILGLSDRPSCDWQRHPFGPTRGFTRHKALAKPAVQDL